MIMKRLLLLSLAAVLSAAFIPKKKKIFFPPGTAKINDTLFADKTEISNFSWQEYEMWVKAKYGANSPEHIAVLPDTLVWRQNNSYNEPYVYFYYRHPAYKEFPVVGISYEQAQAYCKWRTERVKEFMCLSKNYNVIEFEYRLPSKQEWEFLTNNGLGYFSNNAKNEKGKIKFNHRWAIDSIEAKEGYQHPFPDVTAPVTSYEKNLFGLYNLIGNVSEMISEKGISKGGAWCHLKEECRVGKDISYEKPTAWLGFRCVCVVNTKINS
jgi:formylglycine-generating enzyme required for sulfatase activity